MADFDDLQKTLAALTNNFTSQHLRKLNTAAARFIRKSNISRIKKNITPDGGAMVPRKKQKQFNPKTAISFLYPEHGSGKARLVVLTSWTKRGENTIVGFDEKRGQNRHFDKSKIIRFLPPTKTRARVFKDPDFKRKTGKMFKKLGTTNALSMRADSNAARVAFDGTTGNIATQHHYGLSAYISKKRKTKLPERPLLGISDADEESILQVYIDGINF